MNTQPMAISLPPRSTAPLCNPRLDQPARRIRRRAFRRFVSQQRHLLAFAAGLLTALALNASGIGA